MNIYRLCHSSDDITKADFNALSHLSVSTMLDVIQAYNAISHDEAQSKQLLAWTMGTKFVDSCGAMEVSEILGKARSDGASSNIYKHFLSVKEWGNMRVASKDISQSPSAFFQTKLAPRESGAAESDHSPHPLRKINLAQREPDPDAKGPSGKA